MFDIVYVTCSYRISEDYKTALSGDLQHIIIANDTTWLSGRTSVSRQRSFTVLRSTCS